MISVFILPSNIIFRKTKRERVKVRSRLRTKRERQRGRRESPSPATHEPSTSPATQRFRATNPRTNLRLRRRTQSLDHAMNPKPSTQSQSLRPIDLRPHEPSTLPATQSLRLRRKPMNRSLSLCDFDFCCCCGGVGGGVLVVFLLCGGGYCLLAVGCGF